MKTAQEIAIDERNYNLLVHIPLHVALWVFNSWSHFSGDVAI